MMETNLKIKATPAGIQDLIDHYVGKVTEIHRADASAPASVVQPLRAAATRLSKAKTGLRNKRLLKAIKNGTLSE